MLKPFIDQLGDPHTAWLTVAMASTLGGNFTVLGPDRRAARRRLRCRDRLLGLSQGWRAADHPLPRDRDAVAVALGPIRETLPEARRVA